MSIALADRFAGCLLGHAVGDGLGAPFEGMSADLIYGQFGRTSEIVAKPPVEMLYCTDDTHMSAAVAEVLCACGKVEDEPLIQAFARGYDPMRGYGTGMRRLLEAVLYGEEWRPLADNLFPGGSYGNGGAMRVAPVGLLFHSDLDRVWSEAGRSAVLTHRHPLGVQGAQLLAVAVAIATRGEAGDHEYFFDELYRRATEDEYQWMLRTARQLSGQDSLALLGSGLEAHRSVVTAITCFAVSPDLYTGALARALALGDDTDTLMAMTGAISGAHLGISAVPMNLMSLLENEGRGRDYLRDLAGRLYARFSST